MGKKIKNTLEGSGNSKVRVGNEAESASTSLAAVLAKALEAQIQSKF
ncbi:hypothetical protein [Ammoniphilus oxalaticus]|nr:hypothetical protein [Ammoniphilus oxalaticus]